MNTYQSNEKQPVTHFRAIITFRMLINLQIWTNNLIHDGHKLITTWLQIKIPNSINVDSLWQVIARTIIKGICDQTTEGLEACLPNLHTVTKLNIQLKENIYVSGLLVDFLIEMKIYSIKVLTACELQNYKRLF